MDKSYSPRDIESRIYAAWEAAGWFAPVGDGPPYCIVIPPPNVTGTSNSRRLPAKYSDS